MSDTRYVYLMETETEGRYKIGFSFDPEHRARQLTADTNQENIVVVLEEYETEWYREVEKILHQRYAEYRVDREYFDFDTNTLAQVQMDFMMLNYFVNNIDFFSQVIDRRNTLIISMKENELEATRNEFQRLKEIISPGFTYSVFRDAETMVNRLNHYKAVAESTQQIQQMADDAMRDARKMQKAIKEQTKTLMAIETLLDMDNPPKKQMLEMLEIVVNKLLSYTRIDD